MNRRPHIRYVRPSRKPNVYLEHRRSKERTRRAVPLVPSPWQATPLDQPGDNAGNATSHGTPDAARRRAGQTSASHRSWRPCQLTHTDAWLVHPTIGSSGR